MLDTGYHKKIESSKCPAQLLAFDLNTDRLIKRIKIPDYIAQNKQGYGELVTPIVETSGSFCKHTTVRRIHFSFSLEV